MSRLVALATLALAATGCALDAQPSNNEGVILSGAVATRRTPQESPLTRSIKTPLLAPRTAERPAVELPLAKPAPGGRRGGSVPAITQKQIGAAPTSWSSVPAQTSGTGLGVAVDSLGNTIAVGAFQGSIDLGCGTGPLSATGNQDVYVIQYDTSGGCTWDAHLGGTDVATPLGVAVDAAGKVYVVGSFDGTVDFGGGAVTSAGGQDAFVVALGGGGSYAWSATGGGAGDDVAMSVAVSASTVAVVGQFRQTATFSGASLTSAGDADVFLAAYDASAGSVVWSRGIGGAGFDAANAAAFDGSHLAVAGTFAESVDFGGGALTSAGYGDAFLAAYDAATGAYAFAHGYGGTGGDCGDALAVDAIGQIYLGGYFQYSADLGGVVPVTGSGALTGFVAKYDATGTAAWSAASDSTDQSVVDTLGVDPSGNVYAAGYFSGTLAGQYATSGVVNAFVGTFDSAGTMTATKTYGTTGSTIAYAVGYGGVSGIVGTGSFDSTADFGAGMVTSTGASNAFLVSY
jgi:hypothetical protein